MRFVQSLRWLLSREVLPREPQSLVRRGPVRMALRWLFASEAIPSAPPAPQTEDIGFLRWLLGWERLPITPSSDPEHPPEEGVDAAG